MPFVQKSVTPQQRIWHPRDVSRACRICHISLADYLHAGYRRLRWCSRGEGNKALLDRNENVAQHFLPFAVRRRLSHLKPQGLRLPHSLLTISSPSRALQTPLHTSTLHKHLKGHLSISTIATNFSPTPETTMLLFDLCSVLLVIASTALAAPAPQRHGHHHQQEHPETFFLRGNV